tara:strand:- start:39 stop:401 length:363 start_codon:yes stop_codon:yes gene_type:complete
MKLLVGTDIESVDKIKKLIKLKKNLIKKIFFESEYNYAINKVNSDQSLAGIWCAKEAVVKSFSQINKITIREVEIICVKNCAPKAVIRNLKVKDLNFNISVSISHTMEYATAISVLTIFE